MSRLEFIFNARLTVGLGIFIALTIAITRGPHSFELLLAGATIVVFGSLWWSSARIKSHLQEIQDQIEFYVRNQARIRERSALRGVRGADFHSEIAQTLGPRFEQIAADVDLLGAFGFLAQISETFTYEGELELAAHLVKPLAPEDLRLRQKFIERLARQKAHLRHLRLEGAKFARYSYGSLEESLSLWTKPFLPTRFKWECTLVVLTYLVAVGLSVFHLVGGSTETVSNTPWIVFWVAQAAVLLRVGGTHGNALALLLPLSRAAKVFRAARQTVLAADTSERFAALRGFDLYHSLNRAERWVSGLSVSAHPLVFLILNLIFPWTAVFSFLFETERQRIGEQIERQWKQFNELQVDVSAATQFQFQTQAWAKINHQRLFRAEGLRHPLIESTRVVSNSVVWDSTVGLVILTGSNMSGKSTFLRTLALNFLLANSGFPVFADELETFSGELLTCIRVSDSLRDGFSYFFSEVRRLKEMLNEIEKHNPVFFIIDEIFKGTNNRERLIGSRSLIRHLANEPHALGVIATHDLELASLDREIKSVRNYHFREDVLNGTMVFHYLLHTGPSPSTNALLIMKSQGLPVESEPN